MCMIDDCDRANVYVARTFRARKQHRCQECWRLIEPGENYERVFMAYDGTAYTSKTCQHCVGARKLLIKHCDGFLHESVLEDLQNHISEALPWSMQAARFVVAMRRKWIPFSGAGMMAVPR